MNILAIVLIFIFGNYSNAIRVPIFNKNSTIAGNETDVQSEGFQRRFGGFWGVENNAGPYNPSNWQFPSPQNNNPKPGRGNQPQRPQNSGSNRPGQGRKPPTRPQNQGNQDKRPATQGRPQPQGNQGKRLPNPNSIPGEWHPSYIIRPGRANQNQKPLGPVGGKNIPVFEEVNEGSQAGKNPINRSGGWWDKNNPKPKGRSARQAVIFPDDDKPLPPVFEAIRPTTTTESAVVGTSTTSPCERSCPATPEFNPVCSDDGTTYGNMSKLKCAQGCGKTVALLYHGSCRPKRPTTTESQ